MKVHQIDITVEDVKLDVEYTICKPYRGARDSFGVPLEPDEDGGIEEILSVKVGETDIITLLSDNMIQMIELTVLEQLREQAGDYDDYYEKEVAA